MTGAIAIMRPMANLNQKIEAEHLVREWLRTADIPQPDAVEYGYTCVRFLFHESKTCLVFDIDEVDADGDDPG